MAWVKIDDQFYDHPRWADAPGDSIALWLAAMAWCNRNASLDGFIPEPKTRGLVAIKNAPRTCADLCAREAFAKVDGGYVIRNYVEYQQPEHVQRISAVRSASGKKGAAGKWAEKRRAAEYADAPPPPEPPPDEMANPMANAIANVNGKKCPVTLIPETRSNPAAADTHLGCAATPAAAALEMFIEHRTRQAKPHNPGGFIRKLRDTEPTIERAAALAAYLDQHPDASVDDIAYHVYDLGPNDLFNFGHEPPARQGPQADPDCPDCAGSGWHTIAEGTNSVDRCPCASATITPLRRTS